jgi:hypothetical protein
MVSVWYEPPQELLPIVAVSSDPTLVQPLALFTFVLYCTCMLAIP